MKPIKSLRPPWGGECPVWGTSESHICFLQMMWLCWLHQTMIYVSTLTHGHELGKVTKRIKSRIQVAEISFLHKVTEHTIKVMLRSSDIQKKHAEEPLHLHVKRS